MNNLKFNDGQNLWTILHKEIFLIVKSPKITTKAVFKEM